MTSSCVARREGTPWRVVCSRDSLSICSMKGEACSAVAQPGVLANSTGLMRSLHRRLGSVVMTTHASPARLRPRLGRRLASAMGYFVVAYVVVTILATAFAFTLIWVLNLPTSDELGISRAKDPGFLLSTPYILVINLLCWTAFAALYYRKRPVSCVETTAFALLWPLSAMVIDLIFF